MKKESGQVENELVKKQFSILSTKEVVIGLLAFSAACFYMGWLEWSHPQNPPFTGKLAWLEKLLFATWGTTGIVCMWVVFALLMIVLGTVKLLTHEKK